MAREGRLGAFLIDLIVGAALLAACISLLVLVLDTATGDSDSRPGGGRRCAVVAVVRRYDLIFVIWVFQPRTAGRFRKESAANEMAEHIGVRLVVLLALFAAATAFLFERGLVNGSFSTGDSAFSAAERLYLWHVLEAISLLQVPETLHFTRASGYNDWTSGVTVLLFTLIVVLPIIGWLVWFTAKVWRDAGEPAQEPEGQ